MGLIGRLIFTLIVTIILSLVILFFVWTCSIVPRKYIVGIAVCAFLFTFAIGGGNKNAEK